MKKLLGLILIILLISACFTSCDDIDDSFDTSNTTTESTSETNDSFDTSNTTESTSEITETQSTPPYVVPDDEKEVTRVIKTETAEIKMEVTLHGYQSESLGKDFYVKNNEYFIVDVTVINDTSTHDAIFQFLPTSCRDFDPAHNHELDFDFVNHYGDHLTAASDHRGFVHPEMYEIWELKAGESETYTLKLAAGKQSESSTEYDLPYDGWGGIELYDESIYENGFCLFSGSIYFPFSFKNDGSETKNDQHIATEMAFEVVYVSDSANIR